MFEIFDRTLKKLGEEENKQNTPAQEMKRKLKQRLCFSVVHFY